MDTRTLGEVQFVAVSPDLTVANLIGQRGVRSPRSSAPPPIRYPALEEGLEKVALFALTEHATIHMPRMGCGLAGGHWEAIEPILQRTLIAKGLEVFVYDLENRGDGL